MSMNTTPRLGRCINASALPSGPPSPRSCSERFPMNGPKVLAGMFATSGVLHFVNPEPFEKIIPAPLQDYKKELVQISGVAELACAALLVTPPTRRLGGLL